MPTPRSGPTARCGPGNRAAPGEVPVAVAFLSGELRQRQIGVGYAALRDIAGGAWPGGGAAQEQAAAQVSVLTLSAVDTAFAQIGAAAGPGSQAERRRLLA